MTTPATLSQIARILDGLDIEWAIMGALAANRYRSSPRLTNDIDILLADRGPGLEKLEQTFRDSGWTVYRADPAGELLRLRHERYGLVDLLVSGTEFQLQSIQRATFDELEGRMMRILRVEDVIIHKLIAGRFQDLADIEAILEAGVSLDREYLDKWVQFWELEARWLQLRPSGYSVD